MWELQAGLLCLESEERSILQRSMCNSFQRAGQVEASTGVLASTRILASTGIQNLGGIFECPDPHPMRLCSSMDEAETTSTAASPRPASLEKVRTCLSPLISTGSDLSTEHSMRRYTARTSVALRVTPSSAATLQSVQRETKRSPGRSVVQVGPGLTPHWLPRRSSRRATSGQRTS